MYGSPIKTNNDGFQPISKVYWNPRLSTEHGRIAQLLKVLMTLNTNYKRSLYLTIEFVDLVLSSFQRGDCLYDVFAGVGPFSILTAVQGKPTKKQPIPINVFANDLNPESYKSLVNNVKLNGLVGADNIKCFNKGKRH